MQKPCCHMKKTPPVVVQAALLEAEMLEVDWVAELMKRCVIVCHEASQVLCVLLLPLYL